MYELLDVNCHLESNVLDDFTNLRAYHDRIQSLPTLAAYIKSDKFIAQPFNGATAYWGAIK